MKRYGESATELMALNVSQAAEKIGVSRSKMYQIMSIEGFPVVTLGGRRIIPIRAFENWLTEQANINPAPAAEQLHIRKAKG